MAHSHQFGGSWTEEKLERLRKYLPAYMRIFKANRSARRYRTTYVDAFAGSGHRTDPSSKQVDEPAFPEFLEPDAVEFLSGSVRIALQCEPAFDRYIFVDLDSNKIAQLAEVRAEFPDMSDRISIVHSDANVFIQEWCRTTDWRANRAVVFLDPYGMQVEWQTIESIAETKAIDLWLLFPVGMGVNRMLTREAPPPTSWSRRLDRLFGTNSWREAFYGPPLQPKLFGEDSSVVKQANFDSIGAYFLGRLREIFPHVAPNPLVLSNSRGVALYLLCFAASNPYASAALSIAQDVLRR